MKQKTTRKSYGPSRARFDSAPAERVDESVWLKPERRPVTITLPVISMITATVTDDDLGLITDPWEQRAAERALEAARAQLGAQ